jgi:mRNA interferase MazF
MNIKKFHVYLADLNPGFGAEPGKVRPVIVVQTDLLNNKHPSTIVCPITTNVIKKSSVLRVHLFKRESGLENDSDIIVDQVRAIDNKRFIKHLGKLSEKHKQILSDNLQVLILE